MFFGFHCKNVGEFFGSRRELFDVADFCLSIFVQDDYTEVEFKKFGNDGLHPVVRVEWLIFWNFFEKDLRVRFEPCFFGRAVNWVVMGRSRLGGVFENWKGSRGAAERDHGESVVGSVKGYGIQVRLNKSIYVLQER